MENSKRETELLRDHLLISFQCFPTKIKTSNKNNHNNKQKQKPNKQKKKTPKKSPNSHHRYFGQAEIPLKAASKCPEAALNFSEQVRGSCEPMSITSAIHSHCFHKYLLYFCISSSVSKPPLEPSIFPRKLSPFGYEHQVT